jgi:hypothetical protein
VITPLDNIVSRFLQIDKNYLLHGLASRQKDIAKSIPSPEPGVTYRYFC